MPRPRKIDSFPDTFRQISLAISDDHTRRVTVDFGSSGMAVRRRQDFHHWRQLCQASPIELYQSWGKAAKNVSTKLVESSVEFYYINDEDWMKQAASQLGDYAPGGAKYVPPPESPPEATRAEILKIVLPPTGDQISEMALAGKLPPRIPISPKAAAEDKLALEVQMKANSIISLMAQSPGKPAGESLPPELEGHWQLVVDAVNLDPMQSGKWRFTVERRTAPGLTLCWYPVEEKANGSTSA